MSLVPPWSSYTLPRRGRVCEIDVDIADVLMQEYRNVIRARNSDAIAGCNTDCDDDAHPDDIAEEVCDDGSTDNESSSDSSSILSACSWPTADSDSGDSDSDSDSDDSDYAPKMPRDSADEMELDTVAEIPQILRPRRASPPAVDLDITPFPDTLSRAHLTALGFDFVRWSEQPGALVDLRDRIGAMYFGGPVEALPWEQAIIQAGQDMLTARDYIQRDGIVAGLQCNGPAGNRPQDLRAHHRVSMDHVMLAALRASQAIQTVTSFQNAVLRKMAPRAWTAATGMITSLLERDLGLHLPIHIPCTHGLPQPTAFTWLEYQFSTDGIIRKEGGSYIPGMTALTSLGNHHDREGELILWTVKKVVNFPVGSTVLLPQWMLYSFTSVESPGYQMILRQTCENALCEYVANDFSAKFDVVDQAGELKRAAAAGVALYGTLKEFDAEFEDDRGL
ncbi:hypothetical protein B0H13DRAFT_2369768 [Mycena leptocephala]|nr:hypothetical protein B0H13DRAFT_2369768 [Mycena leptocephala]